MGGEHLRRAGAEILVDSSRLAVVGITEVLGGMGSLYRAYRNLKRLIQKKEISPFNLDRFSGFQSPFGPGGQRRRDSGPLLYQPPGLGVAFREDKKNRSEGSENGGDFPF